MQLTKILSILLLSSQLDTTLTEAFPGARQLSHPEYSDTNPIPAVVPDINRPRDAPAAPAPAPPIPPALSPTALVGNAGPSIPSPSTLLTSPSSYSATSTTTAIFYTPAPGVTNAPPHPNPTIPTTTPLLSPTTPGVFAPANTTGPRNHNVAVGQNGTQFTPSALKNIPLGDTLTFYFYPSNYSIVQSSSSRPCRPLSENNTEFPEAKALFSGFHLTGDDKGIARSKFVMTVTGTETMWIYAVDGGELAKLKREGMGVDKSVYGVKASEWERSVCERGMVAVVNPLPKESAGGQTLRAYAKNAALEGQAVENQISGQGMGRVPEEVWGGIRKDVSEKEKNRWEGKHPYPVVKDEGKGAEETVKGGADGKSDEDGNGNSADEVVTYESGTGRFGRDQSLMGAVVLVAVGVFG